MNENLAIIVLAFYFNYFPLSENNTVTEFTDEVDEDKLTDLFDFLYDEKYMEADIYAVFNALMEAGLKRQYIPQIKDEPTNLKVRSDLIYEKYIRESDLQLYQYFNTIKFDIFPIVQRWIKCVFSREFHPTDASILWDAILANYGGKGDEFEFINCISCAMLEYIKADCFCLTSA